MSAVLTGLALLPSTATVVLMSTFATRRLLDRLGVKRMLLLGLTAIGLGLLVFSFVTAGGSYLVNVLPGVLLSALGLSMALPAASVGATTGVARSEQALSLTLFWQARKRERNGDRLTKQKK